ncbi:MAG: diphthamide biosynthesis enzyme Dph2 [Candidatus Thermoplasmatota archaeon]|nr:diphthamide biosynthesis enzyme Dph2 [Candidatus Thermoplasmatota archaeon]
MIDDILKEVEEYRTIAIQAPEGLKRLAEELVGKLGEAFIFADPCYGACDIKDIEAKELGAEVLIHLGHRDFGLEHCLPVLFYPYYYDIDVKDKDIERISEAIGDNAFSICFSINFERVAHKVASALESTGKKASGMRCVLGCSFPSIEDVVLYLGDGSFHPLGIALKSRVLAFDPLTGELKDMSAEGKALDRKRRGNLLGVLSAERIGILVSTKRGQQRMKEAIEMKKMLENKGKKVEIFVMDRIEESSLTGYRVEAYVSTACPRIALDDEFEKPIVNYTDLIDIERKVRDEQTR